MFTATISKSYFVVKIMIFNGGLKDSLDSDLVCQIQLIHIFNSQIFLKYLYINILISLQKCCRIYKQ